MPKHAVALLLPILLLGASVGHGRAARQLSHAPEYQISGIGAFLFYSDRGSFSNNILGQNDLVLRNTIIGEGGSGGPSSSTLVVIETTGEPGSFDAGRSVELAVRNPQKEIFRRQLKLDIVGPQGNVYTAFWLYGTGCEHLTLSAALLGQQNASRRVAELPFRCGE